jgi:putative SOS response-associated peptidase YedK
MEHFAGLVPATSFCEPDNRGEKSVPTWFALDEARSIFFFAGIWRPWVGHRGTNANPADGDHLLFSFLTTAPNAVVALVHEKAMPVLLLDEPDRETWLRGSMEEALALQHPAPPGALKIVATGTKQDAA